MLTHTPRWSHPPGNAVVPSRWQATGRGTVPARVRWFRDARLAARSSTTEGSQARSSTTGCLAG